MPRTPPSSAFDRAILALAVFIAASGPAWAGDAEAQRAVDAGDSAILGLIESGVVDVWSGKPVVLEQPARVRHELGAVIDAQPGDGGPPRVMAIAEGSAAERMQLAVGDRVLSVNGRSLSSEGARDQLRAAIESDAAHLELQVQRDGSVFDLAGAVDRVDVPAYRIEVQPNAAEKGCGRISQTLKPPASERLYHAVLHEIDGRLPGPLTSQTFRVKPGKRVLKMSEAIGGHQFSGMENLQRSKLQRNRRHKYLTIDVEPDTTYFIGVRFDPDKTRPIHDQAYWEPVVWKANAEPCR